MRTYKALAAVLLITASFLPMLASAEGEPSATLRVVVTDATQTAIPGAKVTIYTVDGKPGVTVVADEKGIATFAGVSSGLTQVVAASAGYAFYAEATRLVPGRNDYRVTLKPESPDYVSSIPASSFYVVVRGQAPEAF